MTIHRAALAITLLLGTAAPALAQSYQRPPQAPAVQTPAPAAPAAQQPPARQPVLSRGERTALQPLLTAAQASDWATAATLLPAATEAARGNDAKYLVGQICRLVGVNTQNRQLESQGLDEMIASGGAQPADLSGLYSLQFDLAVAMNDRAKAERAVAEMTRLNPNDVNVTLRLAQLRLNAGDKPGAIQGYQRAIQQQQAAGQPVPAEWRRNAMVIAYGDRLPQTVTLMREYLAAAPTTANWHDAMVIYAQVTNADNSLQLDLFRLMRAANAMTSEPDYMNYWQIANEARLFGEAKTALEEGLSRNLIVRNAAAARERIPIATQRVNDDRTSFAADRARIVAGSDGAAILGLGDIYYTYGQYAEAAAVYRAAVGKSGADANIVNLRLGAALARAGQRAEAETALRAVGAGPRQELAQYWLLWLSTPRT